MSGAVERALMRIYQELGYVRDQDLVEAVLDSFSLADRLRARPYPFSLLTEDEWQALVGYALRRLPGGGP